MFGKDFGHSLKSVREMARAMKKKRVSKKGARAYDLKQDRRVSKIWNKLKPEVKFVETRVALTAFVATGAVSGSPMNALAAGANEGQRVGNKVKDVSFKFRLHVNNTAAAQNQCRFIIFRWNDDVAPNVASVLTAPSATTDYLSAINPNNLGSGQVRILYDQTFTFGRDYSAGVTSASDNVSRTVVRTLKIRGSQQYDANAAADIIKGGLWYCAIGAASCGYALTGIYRYTDA